MGGADRRHDPQSDQPRRRPSYRSSPRFRQARAHLHRAVYRCHLRRSVVPRPCCATRRESLMTTGLSVIGTGGTISSIGASSLDVLDYPDFGQEITHEALFDRFPETRLVADPMRVTFRQIGSTDIGPKRLDRDPGADPSDRARSSFCRRVCHPARHPDIGGNCIFPQSDPCYAAAGRGRGRAAPGQCAGYGCGG
jgi:hypothetical protein